MTAHRQRSKGERDLLRVRAVELKRKDMDLSCALIASRLGCTASVVLAAIKAAGLYVPDPKMVERGRKSVGL